MQIFYKELSLEEGFEVSLLDRNSRIVAGREVSTASGLRLFQSLQGSPIKCWKCHCVADRWISCRGQNDNSRPTLNLFATRYFKTKKRDECSELVMMTRDHIIPKSKGGVDDVANLRPGCEICNSHRGSGMDKKDTAFMLAHPELISQERLDKAIKNAAKDVARKEQYRLEQLSGVYS